MLHYPQITPSQRASKELHDRLRRPSQNDPGINLSRPKGWRPSRVVQFPVATRPEATPATTAELPPELQVEPPPVRLIEGQPCIESIQAVVAWFYKVARERINGPDRRSRIIIPRQVAMYMCKRFTTRSLHFIGKRFGGRDHSTVYHSVLRVGWRIGERPNAAVAEAHGLRPDDPIDTILCNQIVELDTLIREKMALEAAIQEPAPV
jgi:hypothetical protein